MDNSQFRNLLNDEKRNTTSRPSGGAGSSQTFKTPVLGSRARSSIPMTPRSVAGYSGSNDFARQVAEQKRLADGEPPTKKFRSSIAPKGTRLKQGYQDRTVLRRANEDENMEDDKEKRIKALEEMLKLQQIDQATFEKLKDTIGVGGDVSSTHLVKGLDWKLLERVKRGEDINKPNQQDETPEPTQIDLDHELDTVLDKEVSAAGKPANQREKNEITTPETGTSQVLSRDEILRRLKAGRTNMSFASPPPPEPVLGDRFKKVGSGSKAEKKRFVETVRGRRREVLLTTDKEGNVKRKVRWLDKEIANESPSQGTMSQEPLGMEVPAEIAAKHRALLEQQQAQEADDDDIFANVGADYNPLAGLADDSNDDSADSSRSDGEAQGGKLIPDAKQDITEPSSAKVKPSYFSTGRASEEESNETSAITNDPTILAAIRKAAALRQSQGAGDQGLDDDRDFLAHNEDPKRLLKDQQFLEKLRQRERDDARDLDMGFGESRIGDEDDEDEVVWEDGEGGKKSGGRKRGPKKRKGNKDNVNDVMSVIEGRKKG